MWKVILVIILLSATISCTSQDFPVQISVADYMRTCQTDSDCTYVETMCSSCCGYVGINKEYRDEFRDTYADTCRGYRGSVCDCVGPSLPQCRDGACELVWDCGNNAWFNQELGRCDSI